MIPNFNAYKKTQINTSSSEQLVLMLYDGARRFIKLAIKALQDGDMQSAHYNLIRSQDIIVELMCGINYEAGEMAENFQKFYRYMYAQLIQANLKKDRQYAEEVLGMIEELRGAWVQIMAQGHSAAGNNSHTSAIAK